MDSRHNVMASRASPTATAINTTNSLSIMSWVSFTTTEKPARKHFSLHRARISSIARMVSSDAPAWLYWITIMVASPEKNISRNWAGIISVGIWTPSRLLIHRELDTPSTFLTSFTNWFAYPAGIPSTMSILVAAMWNGSSSSFSPWAAGRSWGM